MFPNFFFVGVPCFILLCITPLQCSSVMTCPLSQAGPLINLLVFQSVGLDHSCTWRLLSLKPYSFSELFFFHVPRTNISNNTADISCYRFVVFLIEQLPFSLFIADFLYYLLCECQVLKCNNHLTSFEPWYSLAEKALKPCANKTCSCCLTPIRVTALFHSISAGWTRTGTSIDFYQLFSANSSSWQVASCVAGSKESQTVQICPREGNCLP